MKLFKNNKAFQKGADAKERELVPKHRKEMDELRNNKDLEIADLKNELGSMQRRVVYWQDVYRQITKDRVQVKLDRKELGKVAEDMQYILEEEAIKNFEIVHAIGKVVSKFTRKQIEDKK